MSSKPASESLPPNENAGLKHSEVETALASLSLTWVSVGDYLVVMSGQGPDSIEKFWLKFWLEVLYTEKGA